MILNFTDPFFTTRVLGFEPLFDRLQRLSESSDDQSRVMTPKDAISKGADYIVVGRPITNAPNISEALQEIYNSIL